MDGRNRLDANPADLGPHPLLQLLDLESGPAQQLARTAGRHEPRLALRRRSDGMSR